MVFQRASKCSFHMFCLCFYMSEVFSSFRSLRARSQVFGLMLFLCVILHTLSLGKSLQLLCILPFGMLCLSANSMMFVKILLAVSKCSFHMFCLCFCMSEVFSSFRSLRARSQVFGLMLFLCVILHTMSLGKSLQLLCILPFGMLCLSDISMMYVKIVLAVCMLVGMVV